MSQAQASQARTARVTVCVIEDEPQVRQLICTVLEQSGFAAVPARDGEEGLKIVARTKAGVVVTDLVMPNVEGVEVIRTLKERFPAVRILAISGAGAWGPEDYLEIAKLSGADDCLAKPFNLSVLVAKVVVLARAHSRAVEIPGAA